MKEENAIIKEEYLIFLDDLRTSGKVNMFDATTHLRIEFPELDTVWA